MASMNRPRAPLSHLALFALYFGACFTGSTPAQQDTTDVAFVVARHPDPQTGQFPPGWQLNPIAGATVFWEHKARINGRLVTSVAQMRTGPTGLVVLPREHAFFATDIEFDAAVLAPGFEPTFRHWRTLRAPQPSSANFPGIARPNQNFLVLLKPIGFGDSPSSPGSSSGTSADLGKSEDQDKPSRRYLGARCEPESYIPVHRYLPRPGPMEPEPCETSSYELGCTEYHCRGDGTGTIRYDYTGANSTVIKTSTTLVGTLSDDLKGVLSSLGFELSERNELATEVAGSAQLNFSWGTQNRAGMFGMLCVNQQPVRVPVRHSFTLCALTHNEGWRTWEHTVPDVVIVYNGLCVWDNLQRCPQ